MNNWKFDSSKTLYENVNSLSAHYDLSDEIKESVSQLSKMSYIQGTNVTFNIYKCPTCGCIPCMCRVPMSI